MKNPTILFIQSGKGGVGKTFTSANFSSLLNLRSLKHTLISVEIHGHLLRQFHPNTIELVMDEAELGKANSSLDTIFFAAARDRRHVVVDTGANTGRGLASWMLPIDFFEQCAAAKIRVAIAIAAGSGDRDSQGFFEASVQLAGKMVDWYLVRARHTGEDFELFGPIVAKTSAQVIDLPAVPLYLMDLSKRRCMTFFDIAGKGGLDVLVGARCLGVARQIEAAFQPLIETSFL